MCFQIYFDYSNTPLNIKFRSRSAIHRNEIIFDSNIGLAIWKTYHLEIMVWWNLQSQNFKWVSGLFFKMLMDEIIIVILLLLMLHKFEIHFNWSHTLWTGFQDMYRIYFVHFLCLHPFGKNSDLFWNPSFQSNIQPA